MKKPFIDNLPGKLKRRIQKVAGFGSLVVVPNSFQQSGFLRPITVEIENTTGSEQWYLVFSTGVVFKPYLQANLNINAGTPAVAPLVDRLAPFQSIRVNKITYEVSSSTQFVNEIFYVNVGLDGSWRQEPFNVNQYRSSDQFQGDLLTFDVDWRLGIDSNILLKVKDGVTVTFTVFPAKDQRQ